MVSDFLEPFSIYCLLNLIFALKLEKNIFKPDTYLAVVERTWDIKSRSQILP